MPTRCICKRGWKYALPWLLLSARAAAADGEAAAAATTLDRVLVTTRLEQVSAFETPASISTVEVGDGGRAGVNLAEFLSGVPGLIARDRQNYAQDTQLSIRGFGARATFGVRGIRLYADGIPATMPDGQGQVSHFNLLGGGRVEVLRGPFSALYGNSSGGVVQLWAAGPTQEPEWVAQASVGSDDSRTVGARVRGTAGAMGLNVAAQRFETDGYRDHSAAERTSLNTRFVFDLRGAGELAVVANHLDAPNAKDPLGLTWAQVQSDPRQAAAVAHAFDTRKSVEQNQLGLLYSLPLGPHTLRASAWMGERRVEQFLAVPVAAQANPLSSGGVVDLDNGFGGMDARWSWRGELGGSPAEFHVGANFERQRQHRRGYENFDGDTLGVRGALRRDERNRVENFDQYVQGWWQFAPRWSLLLGTRHSKVRFASKDGYVTAINPDDSGHKTYSQVTPVAGLLFSASEGLRVYASVGRGFETSTFNELAYRADGGAGLAFDLRPAVSRNLELGGKWRSRSGARIEAALFRADTDDELAVARNVGGRSSYRNVGSARRQGVELSAELPMTEAWSLQAAYTWLDAHFRQDFPICTTSGCTDPDTMVPAGTRIPGTARQQLQVALDWQVRDWTATFEGVGVSGVSVNDTGSASAPGYFLINTVMRRQWGHGAHRMSAFVRVDNLLDQDYIGSVIVNEGNGRYYEPGAGRSVLLGLRWSWGKPVE